MRASSHASPDDIDITSVWSALKRSLPRLLLLSLLAGALTWGVLSMMAARYVSEAQLAIIAKGASVDPFRDPRREGSGPDSVAVRMDKEAVNTHVRALLSADLGQKIIAELQLDARPEFNSAAGSPDMLSAMLRMAGMDGPKPGETDQDRTLASYFRQLEVFSPKESRSIVVRFTSSDPELAKTVANRVAEIYRESLATQSVTESNQAQNDLEPKIAKLRDEVAAAEAEAERFRGEANIFKGGNQSTGLNEQQLGELTAELTRAKAARSEAESRARQAREMMTAGTADVLPDVQKSPLMQNLVQQRVRLEREVAEVSAALLPGHPRMRQITSELTGLKKQISAEVAKVVDSLEKEAKVAALREASIDKSLSEIKSRVVAVAPDEVKLRSLEAGAKSKREELESLLAKYESARALATSQAVPVEARIITQARASSVPVWPKKTQLSLLTSFATLLIGMALSVTGALLRGARRQDPSQTLKEPVAARGRPSRAEPSLAAVSTAPAAKVSDIGGDRMLRMSSVGPIAAHLETHGPSSGGCRALVVGESGAIDAGGEAIALVKALAERGHATILIDWSPDGSGLAQKLGINRTPGFTEMLDGTAKFEDVVQRLADSEAHVIASGVAQPYATDGPDPDQINLVLDALDEAYRFIVVVGPHEAARSLFESIEGRFDAGITVSDGKRRVTVIQDPPGTFLGYEVADIELIRFERKDGGPAGVQRIVRGKPVASAIEVRPI
ncbi:MAG: GumC family protein [Hyphomicrobium sp.]